MKHTPLLDRVLVKVIPPPAETLSHIILPESASKSLQGLPTGTVIAVGPGRRFDDGHLHAPNVKVGAVVMYNNANNLTVQHEGEDHVLLREADIFSIVQK